MELSSSKNLKQAAAGRVRNMTLRHKLVVVIMLTCIITLSLAVVIFVGYHTMDARHEMVQSLKIQAEMIGNNCQAALAFSAPRDAEAILESLQVEPSISHACIHDRKGQLFCSYSREGLSFPAFQAEASHATDTHLSDGYMRVSAAVVDEENQETVGSVTVWSDLSHLRQIFRRHVIISLAILIVSSLVAFLMSKRIQGLISSPILCLADVARAVSNQQEYSMRATKHGNDEVGFLIDSFNDMLEQIQQRDLELVAANNKLEVRVEERTVKLIDANEQLKGEVGHRKQAEQALGELNRNLQATVQELRRSNRELQDFANVTAHDLKAPLRAIGTLTDWLYSDYYDTFDEQGREQLQLVKGRVTRMNELIEGILRYSEIGRGHRCMQAVNLDALIAEVVAMVSVPAPFAVRIEGPLPVVTCERIRLLQVFQNLIGNAVKYMDKQEGCIEIRCQEGTDHWEFSVADNGPGIDQKYHAKIFKMFQTLAPRDEIESTGIGLAVVKKIVELYGGRVWVESHRNLGSTFYFTLPKFVSIPEAAEAVTADTIS